MPKDVLNRCKDCKLFKEDPSKKRSEFSSKYTCENRVLDSFPMREACKDFELRIDKMIPIHRFDTVNDQIKCPSCGELNTLKIPEHGEMSICKICKILIKRVKKARFVGKIGVKMPKDRIIVNNTTGFLTVKIFKYKRSILLTKGQELNLISDLDLKLHILIEPNTNRAYFGDEVWNILLAGGKITSDAKKYLKKRKIEIIEFTDEKIAELESKEEIAEEYRKLIRSLRKRGKLDEIGREGIFAKIMSNIIDTEELGKTMLDKTLAQKLVLEQLDWVVTSYLAPRTKRKKRRGRKPNPHKNLNRLRSIEGNAEKPAWQAQKFSLPRGFKILERGESRHAPSDLFTGVRAYDPYNAGLNKLYFLLAGHGSNALETGGLSKYAPGPGIIHHRVKRYKRRKIKQVDFISSFNKKNRELLYDFIDAYRPPLRHHFGKYIRKGKIEATDFFWQRDEWGRRVHNTGALGLEVKSISISESGEYIVAGGMDNRTYLYDNTSFTPLWNHTTGNWIYSVDISQDGKYIVAGSKDKKVYFFNNTNSTPLWIYNTGFGVESVSISEDGQYITVGSNGVYLFHRTQQPSPNNLELLSLILALIKSDFSLTPVILMISVGFSVILIITLVIIKKRRKI
ncbi:MAG: hypothetical protein ACTSRG_26735 [Candidatus Helarchaeota archaeon]